MKFQVFICDYKFIANCNSLADRKARSWVQIRLNAGIIGVYSVREEFASYPAHGGSHRALTMTTQCLVEAKGLNSFGCIPSAQVEERVLQKIGIYQDSISPQGIVNLII